MLIEKLKDQWICSCGNWVEWELSWCPDCCEDRLPLDYVAVRQDESNIPYVS